MRPVSVVSSSFAVSSRMETTGLSSSDMEEEEMYGTADTSMRTSQTGGSTRYESAKSVGNPAPESRASVTTTTTSFKSIASTHHHQGSVAGSVEFGVPLSEDWATATATPTVPTLTPRGSSCTISEETRDPELRSVANLEPPPSEVFFYDSVAASVVGSPALMTTTTPRGSIYQSSQRSSSERTTTFANLDSRRHGASGSSRSPYGSSAGMSGPSIAERSISPANLEPVFYYESAAASVVGTSSAWGSSSIDLPEIPSESQVNSPVVSLVTLGSSSGRGIGRKASTPMASRHSISEISPLPQSISLDHDATSAATPTSLVVSSESDSDSDGHTLSSFTQTSTSFHPPAKSWASSTDVSYNSSVLQPSPSIPSISFRERDEQESHASFDSSCLRPSSLASTSPRSFAVSSPLLRPPGPIPPSTATTSPRPVSSPTEISSPSTLHLSPASSPPRISRPLPRVPISLATESLISTSLLGSELNSPRETSPFRPISTPSTQSSLLQRITPSETLAPRRTLTPTPAPTPLPAPSLPTPSGSIIVSVTTPHGSGSTEKPSLRTEDSEPSPVIDQRDLTHVFDRLVDEIHTYNFSRGLEHQGLINDVRTLKNEVRGLAGLVRMGPPLATPAVLMVPPPQLLSTPSAETIQNDQPRRVAWDAVDRAIGGSSPLSSDEPVNAPRPALSPSQSTSEVGSVHSYLSSHHSDDDVLHIEEELLLPPIHSPIWHATDAITKEPATDLSLQPSSDSDSLSSSPYASSSELDDGWLGTDAAAAQPAAEQPHEVHQLPESVERALAGIRDQIRTLDDGQNANVTRLESLNRHRDPDEEDRRASALLERLGHIEDLLRAYLEQAQQQQQQKSPMPSNQNGFDQVPVPPPPPLQRPLSVSSSDSGDSLRRLRRFMGDLVNQVDNNYDHPPQRNRMSMPPLSLPATARPSGSRQRLEDVLQPLDLNISPPAPAALPRSEIPRIEPFNFLYGDSVIGRGERPRSASPISVDKLPPLRHAASVMFPIPVPVTAPRPKKRRRRIEGGEGEHGRNQLHIITPDAERLLSQRRIKRDVGGMRRPTQMQQRQIQELPQPQQQQQQIQQPPRQLVLRPALKSSSYVAPQASNPQPQGQLSDQTRIRAVPAERTQSDSQTKSQQNALPSRTKSWYRPRDATGAKRPMTTFVDPAQFRYLPVANAPPTAVAMPSLGPSVNILREQRLAQLATVDQQRELMKYMKGLNEWLERDVRNRREEFQDVFQTVADLRRQIRGMRRKKGRTGNGGRDRKEEGRRRQRAEATTTIRVPSGGPSAPTTPVAVAPQPQRWTAVPALIQPFPVHSQQHQRQQRVVGPPPPMVAGNSSRARGPQAPFQPQSGRAAQPQPTIILLPAGGGGQGGHSGLHPMGWQYSGNERVERSGTGRSRR